MNIAARFFHSHRIQSGFTLIELMLVIALIGILAAITIPMANGMYHRQQLINSANEMVTMLKQAQNMAISNFQRPYASSNINDCTPTKPYVRAYTFRTESAQSYGIRREFKLSDDRGYGCAVPEDERQYIQTNLPAGISFWQDAGNTPGYVRYDVVTAKITTDLSGATHGRAFYRLVSDRIDVNSLSYYICVTQGRVYAQTEPCW